MRYQAHRGVYPPLPRMPQVGAASLRSPAASASMRSSFKAAPVDDWRVWIAADWKGGRKKRTTTDNRLSGPKVAKRVSVAKQVLRCAVRWGWIAKSPFDGRSQANPARSFYVDHSTIMDVLDACPSVGWKVVVGLCRFAGLRCPSEVGSVTWADVNWEKGRLTVRSQKTEHHGADHAVRVVPIGPDLRLILDDAWSVAGAGTGSQQTRFRSGKQGGESVCDAKCDAISQGRVELLARAVLLVAGMEISEPDRAAILARVVADAGRNLRS